MTEEGSLEGQAQIEIHLASADFPAAPGSTTTIPVLLQNRGQMEDVVTLAVGGVPAEWVSTSSAFISVAPGQQQQVALTIQPPASVESRAGHYPIRIQANSQAAGGQVAEAACTLTVGAYTEFSCDLHPQRLSAGNPGQVTVENQGNVEQGFTLTWRSDGDDVVFDPGPTQELRVPAGGTAAADFRASPRSRPLFGGQKTYPFSARVQSADQRTQSLSGAVVSQGLIPTWLVGAVIVIAILCLCVSVGGVGGILGGTGILDSSTAEPAEPAAPAAPPEQAPEQPAEPQAPEKPAEPPAEGGEAPPAEGGGETSRATCTPMAFGLALAPLAVIVSRRLG